MRVVVKDDASHRLHPKGLRKKDYAEAVLLKCYWILPPSASG